MHGQRFEIAGHDCVEWRGSDGTRFLLQRLRPGVLLAQISGDDRGLLGSAPFDELERELTRHQPLELFFDLRAAAGASAEVREAWTGWFQRKRAQLERVTILASSRFVELTVEIAKLFSRTGELIRVYSNQQRFEQALAISLGAPVQLPALR